MSEKKLLENKQLIHVISEAIVMFGITYYFSSKNKQLLIHIEELHHRLDEKDDQIEKIETQLTNITNAIKQLQEQMITKEQFIQQTKKTKIPETREKTSKQKNEDETETEENYVLQTKNIPEKQTTERKIEKKPTLREKSFVNEFINPKREVLEPIQENEEPTIEDTTDDSELDKEIQEELNELVDNDVLKKED